MKNWITAGCVAMPVALLFIIGTLTYADLYSGNLACALSLGASQWPKFLGCALAHHEGLAGGLIAAAAALIAGGAAYWSAQIPIKDAAMRKVQAQADAKIAAVLSLTQPIHAAAAAMSQFRKILQAGASGTPVALDDLNRAAAYVEQSLGGSLIRNVIPELAINERLLATMIVERLQSFTILAKTPGRSLSPKERFENHVDLLMKLRLPLRGLDSELADVFDRDGDVTVQQNVPVRGGDNDR